MVLSLTVNWFPPSYRATIVSSWQLCFEAIGYTLDETTHGENLMNSFQVRRFRVSMWWAYRHRTWCQARLKDLSKTLQSDGKQVWIEACSRCFAAFAWPLRGGGGDCDVCSTSLLLDGWMDDGWLIDADPTMNDACRGCVDLWPGVYEAHPIQNRRGAETPRRQVGKDAWHEWIWTCKDLYETFMIVFAFLRQDLGCYWGNGLGHAFFRLDDHLGQLILHIGLDVFRYSRKVFKEQAKTKSEVKSDASASWLQC